MTDELIVKIDNQLSTELEDSWDKLTKTSDFIPRIQLYGSNSNAVKKELINQGRYGFPKSADEIIDLGKEVPCIPLSWCFKAMTFTDNDTPIVCFDPKDPLFEEIQIEADKPGMNGSVYGIEFLLFVPQSNCADYVTFFLNSKSSRRQASSFRDYLGKAATLKVELASNKKGSWHVPKITQCSTPFENLPDEEKMNERIYKFKNPPKQEIATEVELAAASEDVVR